MQTDRAIPVVVFPDQFHGSAQVGTDLLNIATWNPRLHHSACFLRKKEPNLICVCDVTQRASLFGEKMNLDYRNLIDKEIRDLNAKGYTVSVHEREVLANTENSSLDSNSLACFDVADRNFIHIPDDHSIDSTNHVSGFACGSNSVLQAQNWTEDAVDTIRAMIERFDSVEGYVVLLDSFANMGGICDHLLSEIRDQLSAHSPIFTFSCIEEESLRTVGDDLSWGRINELISMANLWDTCSLWIPLGYQGLHYNKHPLHSAGLSIYNLCSPISSIANMSSISGHLLQDPTLKISHLYESCSNELNSLSYDDFKTQDSGSADYKQLAIECSSFALDSYEHASNLEISSDGRKMIYRSSETIIFQTKTLSDVSSHLITDSFAATRVQDECEKFKSLLRSQNQREFLKRLHSHGYTGPELEEMVEEAMAISDNYAKFFSKSYLE